MSMKAVDRVTGDLTEAVREADLIVVATPVRTIPPLFQEIGLLAKDDAVVHYAMGGIEAKVFTSQYLTELPDTETLRQEIVETQHALEARAATKGRSHG